MATPAQLAKDARLLHLTLERLECPVDAVCFVEVNLRHGGSAISGDVHVAKADQSTPFLVPEREAYQREVKDFGSSSHLCHILGGRTFLPLHDVELDAVAFGE